MQRFRASPVHFDYNKRQFSITANQLVNNYFEMRK